MSYPSIPVGGARRRYLAQPLKATVTSSTSVTCAEALTCGEHILWADNDVYFRQGSSSATATSGSWYALAWEPIQFWVSGESEDTYMATLAISTTATVWIGRLY